MVSAFCSSGIAAADPALGVDLHLARAIVVVSITANVTLAKMKPTNLKPLRSTIVVLRRFFGVVLTIGRTVFGSGGSKGAARYPCLALPPAVSVIIW